MYRSDMRSSLLVGSAVHMARIYALMEQDQLR
jgi:hypothetical protein